MSRPLGVCALGLWQPMMLALVRGTRHPGTRQAGVKGCVGHTDQVHHLHSRKPDPERVKPGKKEKRTSLPGMGPDGPGAWLEQPLIPPAAAPLRNPIPAQALAGWRPQMGYFISKATFSCAVICLICYPCFRPHISHTHQTEACLGGEEGGKEAGGDTEEAGSGWGLALAPRGAKSNEFRDLRGDWPVIAPDLTPSGVWKDRISCAAGGRDGPAMDT